MNMRGSIAQLTATTAVVAGPAIAGAEATGALQDITRPIVVYVLSAGLTLIGAMFTALVWFFKREHAAITGGIKGQSEALKALSASVTTLSLTVERSFAELRGEVARRMLIEEHGRSSARVHEKVNKLGRTVSYLTGKLGMHPQESDSEPDKDDDE